MFLILEIENMTGVSSPGGGCDRGCGGVVVRIMLLKLSFHA